MNAIREIVKPVNHKLIIELPENFKEESEYEVIILINDEKQEKKEKFFNLAGKIEIDETTVNQLRKHSML